MICALIASSKGRSAIGWFLIGFLLGFIGLIIICVVSDLKKQQAKEERLRAETRRLREQVRKDRMIADRRHRNIEQRLGAHDRVVGIDTSQGAPDRQIGHAGYDDYPGTDDYADDEQAAEDAFYADAAPPPPRPRSRQHPRSPRQR
ncbi:MAG: hypothetical protein ACOCVS_02030 [Planctomycetota bacterium]